MKYEDLTMQAEGGSIEGYAVDSAAKQIPNWLSEQVHGVSATGRLSLLYQGQLPAHLGVKNLGHGPRAAAEQGLDSGAVYGFIEQAFADLILLVADRAERNQREDFSIETFVPEQGICKGSATPMGPLMAWPQEEGRALAALLRKKPPA